MDETTTPVAPANDGAEAQPSTPVVEPAAQPQEPVVNNQPTEPLQSDNSEEWLKSKGVDPSDPEALAKVAQMYREAEKNMHQVTTKAAQLEKSIETQPAATADYDRVAQLERDLEFMKFKDTHKDWQEHESSMVTLLDENVRTPYGVFPRKELLAAGMISLNEVYLMAKGSSAPQKTEDVGQVLQSIANKQRAGATTPSAINSAPSSTPVDPVLEGIKRARGA